MNIYLILFLNLSSFTSRFMTLTPEERKEILDVHNHLRRSVVPPASNMQELKYDENLEKVVYKYLEQCKFEHRNLDNYGENGRLASDSNITNTVMSWFQERVYFNISERGPKRCSKDNSQIEYLNEVQCGHYQMMVKGTLKSLGCGYKFCPISTGYGVTYENSFITFCFYNSGLKDQPYETGSSCSDCEAEYQFCHNDLCVQREQYDKNSRSCKLKCKNCGVFFDPKNSCLCDCPDGTYGNSCKGIPLVSNNSCSPCASLAETCNHGIEGSSNGVCRCKCSDQYQGEFCQYKKNQLAASYLYIIEGSSWRYQMKIPVNLIEFKKSLKNFQSIIADDANKMCLDNEQNIIDCAMINEHPLKFHNVFIIPGFPILLDNGSLAIRIFLSYQATDPLTEDKFVDPSILYNLWSSKTKAMDDFIAKVRRIHPKSPDEDYQEEKIIQINSRNLH